MHSQSKISNDNQTDFSDAGAFWLREYESETFKEEIEQLWQTLKPFYQQMHAYVRAKLRDTYGDQFTEDGLIPAHLLGTCLFAFKLWINYKNKKNLGNMWAQSWENIYSLVVPFPEKTSIDVTEQMKQQVYCNMWRSCRFPLTTACSERQIGLHTAKNVPSIRWIFHFLGSNPNATWILEGIPFGKAQWSRSSVSCFRLGFLQ